MSLQRCAALLAAVSLVALCGCGGGGGGAGDPGGGSVTPPPPPPPTAYDGTSGGNFTSWSAVQPSTPVTLTGLSKETSYTLGAGGAYNFAPNSSLATPTMTTTFVYDAYANYLAELQFSDGTQTLSFIPPNASSVRGQFNISGSPIQTWQLSSDQGATHIEAILVDPVAEGWDYQTFGVWQKAQNVGYASETGAYASYSLGKPTAGAAIPTSGSATFTGKLAGYYSVGATRYNVGAPMTLNVNFSGRSAAFSSTELRKSGPGVFDPAGVVITGSSISGTLIYSSQSNLLTGTLQTADSLLTGPASAQFYGPAAQEVGGAFVLAPTSGNSSDRIIAGFGAKR